MKFIKNIAKNYLKITKHSLETIIIITTTIIHPLIYLKVTKNQHFIHEKYRHHKQWPTCWKQALIEMVEMLHSYAIGFWKYDFTK